MSLINESSGFSFARRSVGLGCLKRSCCKGQGKSSRFLSSGNESISIKGGLFKSGHCIINRILGTADDRPGPELQYFKTDLSGFIQVLGSCKKTLNLSVGITNLFWNLESNYRFKLPVEGTVQIFWNELVWPCGRNPVHTGNTSPGEIC